MNKVLLGFMICLFTTANSFAQEHITVASEKNSVKWESTYKGALKKSKRENKPLLIYFTGSDWCGPCKVLDKKLFHSEKFKKLADKGLILYEADNPRNKDIISKKKLEVNANLQSKFNVRSFPTLVFVNQDEAVIGFKKGLILTEYYYPFIQSVIENY